MYLKSSALAFVCESIWSHTMYFWLIVTGLVCFHTANVESRRSNIFLSMCPSLPATWASFLRCLWLSFQLHVCSVWSPLLLYQMSRYTPRYQVMLVEYILTFALFGGSQWTHRHIELHLFLKNNLGYCLEIAYYLLSLSLFTCRLFSSCILQKNIGEISTA